MDELKRKLDLRMEQKLFMSPYLQQMFEIMQLPILDLEQRINEEVETNPILEIEEEENTSVDDENFNQLDNVKYDEIIKVFEDSSDMAQYSYKQGDTKQTGLIEGLLVKPESLQEHLLWQLRLEISKEEQFAIGERIISNINEKGYLTCSLEEITKGLNITQEEVKKVLQIIQTFEPYGVGTKDLQESLLVQVRYSLKKDLWAERILLHYFDLLSKHKYKTIANKLGISEKVLHQSIHFIQQLDPNPGYQYNSKITEYVVPDVIVNKTNKNELLVIINDEWIPQLRISRRYSSLIQNKNVEKKIKHYLKEKVKYAIMFIKSIEQRNTTLYRISHAIVKFQKHFFLGGNEHIVPLTLKDIADDIGVHESTVSRVTSSKYVQTPHGIYEMKYFFSKRIDTMDEMGISSKAVMELMRSIIEHEEKALSDEDISMMLKEQGIKISRRTISKYRKQLKILPSNLRK